MPAEESSVTETVVVITGAAPLAARAVAAVPAGALLIAADGGLDHALAAGLEPALLIGDLDSVSPAGLAWAKEHAEVLAHPVDKAETDTELAVSHAAALGPTRLVLLAGHPERERLDHLVTTLGSLGAPALAGIASLEAWWGGDQLRVAHGPGTVVLDLAPGTTFSVLAMHGRCTGITVDGARWPLVDHALAPLVGLGVSNEAVTRPVSVSVATGIVTVVVPGAPT
jgi:thiamine pyrophosphokinase